MIALFVIGALLTGVAAEAQYEYVNPYLKTYKLEIQPVQPIRPYTNPYLSPHKSSTSNFTSSYSTTNPARVVSPTGEYLGTTSSNKYDSESINNPYGRYGSKYSSESVNNPYGKYGSRYSPESANNPYATNTPKLYGETTGDERGRLSANQYDPESIENRYSPRHDAPLANQRQLMRVQILNAYSRDPSAFLDSYLKLPQAQQDNILRLLSE